MKNQYVVVLITAPSREVARQIAHYLVENRLAACVNLLAPIESIYTWEGATHQDEEVLMIAKTRADLVDQQLVPQVRKMHPYDNPEIISLPVLAGSKIYLDWIAEMTDPAED